ncbi:Protein N-terminal amidase, partial [Pseudocercospora fuligena]
MKIAILQFNPTLGEIDKNISHANTLLSTCTTNLDLLVLPEMAFSGYNFSSLTHIQPYLEPTASGPTTQWAIKTAKERNCTIIVGYPEKSLEPNGEEKRYNSTVTVGPSGQILANYRKSFLYYTDETWASEGFLSTTTHTPFFASTISTLSPKLPNNSPVGHGICMDINPYQFSSPWTNYEFATHMLRNRCHLVVLSMAWLTRLTPEECLTNPERPDMETVAYWLERFWPFVDSQPTEPIVVVFANRCGSEGGTVGERRMEHGEVIELGDRVAYAGSSCVMRFQMGSVKLWEHDVGSMKGDVGLLGKGEEGVLVVDTGKAAG